MLVIDEDKYIHINRGDSCVIHFSTEQEDGAPYMFQPNDVVRFSVKEKYSDAMPVLRKDITVAEETENIDIELSKNDTTIGELINKPKKYVYDIAINEDNTVIGYDEDTGAKYFILYPEASNDE